MKATKEIYIEGTEKRRSIRVIVNRKEYWLPGVMFKILLKLCIAHPAWVKKHSFGKGETAAKYIYRLRRIVPVKIENGCGRGIEGCYRIKADVISINTGAFVNHPDFEIRGMVELLN